ncbi:FAD/NAD(P)-binding protein (plasmid) [Agrobacterium vitis]|uniref:FAD/NAD(P)-binding protein n=1 Tax=Agrobacterium vitis TaxID=373 RepID=UPI003D2E55C1
MAQFNKQNDYIRESAKETGKARNIVRIAILGMGPRGLTALERIVAHAGLHPDIAINILVFDPQDPGFGCHSPAQPRHLLVNTVASQLTLFSDETVRQAGPVLHGPSFYEWLADTGVMPDVNPDGYYSRALFGEYLGFVYAFICRMAPDHVRIVHRRASVERAERQADGRWILHAGKTQEDAFDYMFLTSGHTPRREAETTKANARLIADPYPVAERLSGLNAGVRVAVEGMGLTTFDILSELTIGRDGRFYRSSLNGKLHYQSSGREPQIIAYSRSGLPLSARAVNQKGVSGQYKARFLTPERIGELRKKGKIDFAADILPLLQRDMEYVYYTAYLKKAYTLTEALLFGNRLLFADEVARAALIERYIPSEDRFSFEKIATPLDPTALASHNDFRVWLRQYLQADLKEAEAGNIESPLKAACDVLRDLRDNLRAAIDFSGLSEASNRWLHSEFVSVMNRLAVGPPRERIEQMIALMEAGILIADLGPGTRAEADSSTGGWRIIPGHWQQEALAADILIKARISLHSPLEDASPFINKILQDGHARIFRNGEFHPSGFDLDRNLNLIAADGSVTDNVWALGMLSEGPKFYTFIVPRPGVNSTAIVDAGRAVSTMFAAIRQKPANDSASSLATPRSQLKVTA